ncbi:tRNA (adenosine(37)-N6)-threonylcarbamoyltransferase complex ATPase subunit type 1 TsaE [Sphingomonas xanthus]|uniref:tRNA threonylcarbamoyladenosine biosynthesis protein TsaE n=1 Tax=Sphingomonas xanthus TaxID=2594473 RepID=A0A516IP89_9SPHN|nr:tRNA (adenosine(37)-N6)-threonylcarbamoyltransferase complex ATPase subunit type 1 TsaE [Sphingomonas xanthus]QDP18738.1 tRNA (adenosine(37)-N6)-threonylcarbamoyltransferase complex ATPase subunit type 1 TsaE [Sphingomonas xanthus]
MILKNERAALSAGARIAGLLRAGDVITLRGPLAAGKTTLVRGLLGELGHQGDVPSPSFAIVQPYDALEPPVWHVDLYRLEDASEIDELGLDDIRAEGVLIIEWPEHGPSGAWPEALALSLEMRPDGARALTAQVPEAWEGRWPLQ